MHQLHLQYQCLGYEKLIHITPVFVEEQRCESLSQILITNKEVSYGACEDKNNVLSPYNKVVFNGACEVKEKHIVSSSRKLTFLSRSRYYFY